MPKSSSAMPTLRSIELLHDVHRLGDVDQGDALGDLEDQTLGCESAAHRVRARSSVTSPGSWNW